jgi:octaprenyl-diphosphate synthase
MLAVIEEMILAESLQLERRGQLDGDVADYFRVAEGKTAALFRWAMRAGARAGGCDDAAVAALEAVRTLGLASDSRSSTTASISAVSPSHRQVAGTDLREGKLTLPLLLALPRDRELVGLVAAAIADDSGAAGPANHAAIASRIAAAGGLAEARREAQRRIAAAIDALAILPDGPGKTALITVAEATATRDK